MVEPTHMSLELNEALVRIDSGDAIGIAVEFRAESTTRMETFERPSKLLDKVQAVSRFFAFTGKHPGEVMPEDVRAWRRYL